MERRETFKNHLGQTSDLPLMLNVSKGEGVYLYDQDNQAYLDLISGISVSFLGHHHPSILNAIKKQADQYLHTMVYGEYMMEPQIAFAELIVAHLPSNLNNVFFVNSGSEATEAAIKLAKRYTGKPNVINCDKAYHGSTYGALSVAGNESLKNSFRPLMPGVKTMRYHHTEDIDLIDQHTAAVIIETIQGEAGARVPDKGFLQSIRDQCQKTGTLLIFDEIQAGMGRTGKLWAFNHFGVKPDILLLGKAFGGGLPLATFISDKAIMDALKTDPVLGHISTFGGNPIACAAGKAAMEVLLNEGLAVQALKKESIIRQELEGHHLIKSINGKGLMLAAEIGNFDFVYKTIQKCFQNKLLSDWFVFNNQSIRIAPPLNISDVEIKNACRLLKKSLEEAFDQAH